MGSKFSTACGRRYDPQRRTMANDCVIVEGLEELNTLLSETNLRRTAKRYLTNIEKKAAAPVIAAMKASCPKNTGHMEDTIGSKTKWKSSADGEQLTIKIGPGTEPYPKGKPADIIAFFLEFGCNTRLGQRISGLMRKRTRKTSHEQDNIPARHFLYRSEEHTSELQSLRHLVCRL